MNERDKVVTVYQFFAAKVSKNNSFTFLPTKPEESMIDSLINFLVDKNGYKNISAEMVFDYFAFQFEYWSSKTTQFGKNKVMFNWTVGKKAFDRWHKDGKRKRFFYERYCREMGIGKSDVLLIVNYTDDKEKNQVSLSMIEEIERSRFLNKSFGFSHCILSTSLYSEDSKSCVKCNFSSECKKMLERKVA